MATEKELELWIAFIKMEEEKKREFVDKTVTYMKTHPNYENLSKEEVITQTLMVLAGDIGAAQAFLDVINVPYDLYLRTSK